MTVAEYNNLMIRQLEIRAELVRELTSTTIFTPEEIIELVNVTIPLFYPRIPEGF